MTTAIPATPSSGVEAEDLGVGTPVAPKRRGIPWAGLAIGLVVAAGIAARFVARSHLWLDEALSVNIAALPVSQIPEALRHDGSPPLYYVVLHYWMDLFGSGTIAVRAL